MQILPGQINSGSIVLSGNIPTLAIGKTLVVTVLSTPKAGQVLVSMFGRHIQVETTMPLHKGQVINLKVHSLSPRIVLKPAGTGAQKPESGLQDIGGMVSRLVGSFGEKPVEAFLLQEIIESLSSRSGRDITQPQAVASLIEQVLQYPQALAFLFIPLVNNDSQASATVRVEREDDAYVLSFEVQTDHIGNLECTARVDQAIDVEIRTPSPETADFLGKYVHELKESLEPFGVRHIGVSLGVLKEGLSRGVDVLV